ncbi:MAG: hypothetical protein QM484_07390 [Woeseiaceae bacterium]
MRTQFKYSSTLFVAMSVCLYISVAIAQQAAPFLNFKFNHLSNSDSINNILVSEHKQHVFSESKPITYLNQLNATWTYPWETKRVNVDVGLSLRHVSGYGLQNNIETDTKSPRYFQRVLPLVHASALFSFPVEGLSAGIEGSHLNLSHSYISDYRAKVSYEWGKDFGLQGGWQHQQFNIEQSAGSFEKKGAFVDFYLKF